MSNDVLYADALSQQSVEGVLTYTPYVQAVACWSVKVRAGTALRPDEWKKLAPCNHCACYNIGIKRQCCLCGRTE